MTAMLMEEGTDRRTPAADSRWEAVAARDARFDGRLVYGVRTTGVYCRPSCSSRRPRRENVVFFGAPAAAESAGFRPCRRCHPNDEARTREIHAVLRACRLLDDSLDQQPGLKALGAAVGLSPWHLQRRFTRIIGVSPRAYVEARRAERLRQGLRRGETVSRAVYGAGYGSGRPVYERKRELLGMTPATYRRGGQGATVRWTLAESPLGTLLVAATERGVCSVQLGDSDEALEASLRRELPAAELRRDPGPLTEWVRRILDHLGGTEPRIDVPVDVRATAFQWRVWEALRGIPRGATRSYAEIAQEVGAAGAARAVAKACASNPVALVVPCHRVVRADGAPGGYRWGAERKQKLLAIEAGESRTNRTPRT
jgi:AraC family transcriptional regulator of adaptative response/methylated-DNA-[protein]-cysteine methyltransferase